MAHPSAHLLPPVRGGRSHHSDPWREGYRVDEKTEAAASTTGGLLRARDPDSGGNNPDAVQVETGVVTHPARATFSSRSANGHSACA